VGDVSAKTYKTKPLFTYPIYPINILQYLKFLKNVELPSTIL